MKRILSLSLIFVLILAACGNGNGAVDTPDFSPAPPGVSRPGVVLPDFAQAETPRPEFIRGDGLLPQILDALYYFRGHRLMIYAAHDMCPDTDDLSELYAHQHPFYGETLTISVPVNFRQPNLGPFDMMDHAAAQYFADSYMRQNPGVNIEVRSFGGFQGGNLASDFQHPDVPAAQQTVRDELTAGTAGTLFSMAGAFDPLSPHTASHLADWYPIMRSDPRFNADDWFMNVLYASMVNGSLRSFPIAFRYMMLAANNTVPGLAAAFEQRDFITYADILTLHGLYAAHLDIHENFSPARAFLYTMNEFVSVTRGGADFLTRFPGVMEHARQLTGRDRPDINRDVISRLNAPGNFRPPDCTAVLRQISELDAFYDPFWFSEIFSMMEFRDMAYFSNPRPVADSAGRVIAEILPLTFELNASASYLQQAMAWDFVFHMHQPENQHRNTNIENAIYVPLLRQQTARRVTETANWAQGQGYELYHDLETTIEMVTEQLIQIGRMPMSSMHPIYTIIRFVSFHTLRPFEDHETDISDAALELQETVERLLSDFSDFR